MSEAANTVTAEGRTVRAAVELAAAELGVDFSRVAHKLDASHFRGPDGRPRAVDTVKVIAWVREGEPEPAPRPAPRDDRRDDRREGQPRRWYWSMTHGQRYIWGVTAGIVRALRTRLYGEEALPQVAVAEDAA